MFNQLQKTNLVVTWENVLDGKSYLYLIDEFHDLFLPHIEEALKHPAADVSVYVGATSMDEIVNKVKYRCKEATDGIKQQLHHKFPGEMTEEELDAFDKQIHDYENKIRHAAREFQIKYNTKPSAYQGRAKEMERLLDTLNTAQHLVEDMRDMIDMSQRPLKEHVETLLSRPTDEVLLSRSNQQQLLHKIGRNAPCPCGSGKKFKHCCGKK